MANYIRPQEYDFPPPSPYLSAPAGVNAEALRQKARLVHGKESK